MIEEDLKASAVDLSRVMIEPLADYYYEEQKWEEALRNNVAKYTKAGQTIAIAGHIKDDSSYYLESFPEWGFIAVDNYKSYNATDFRLEFYKGFIKIDYMCSDDPNIATYKFLNDFMKTQSYHDLVKENDYVIEHKKSWKPAPYKPILVTVDALVIVNDHILLIQRNGFPGKNIWALPGGFLDYVETISQGIIRELFEETNIDLTVEQLAIAKRKEKVFDYPSRSVRGRIVSHVGLFIFEKWPNLPKIKAADDAKNVKWISIRSIINNMYDRMLEDHYQIITVLLENYYRNKV
ncbi:ADP-ribose pyrophosphatase [Francisella halioticida]|nr:ADP-ribose pyrophosphatase [Francisella halioticida]